MVDRPLFLSRALRGRIARSCDNARPREACGLIAGRDGRGRKLYACSNAAGDEHSYSITPGELYRASLDADRYGWTLLGSWHSHPNGPDELSAADITAAPSIAGWVHVLVSFDGPAVTVRAFTLGPEARAREVHV